MPPSGATCSTGWSSSLLWWWLLMWLGEIPLGTTWTEFKIAKTCRAATKKVEKYVICLQCTILYPSFMANQMINQMISILVRKVLYPLQLWQHHYSGSNLQLDISGNRSQMEACCYFGFGTSWPELWIATQSPKFRESGESFEMNTTRVIRWNQWVAVSARACCSLAKDREATNRLWNSAKVLWNVMAKTHVE